MIVWTCSYKGTFMEGGYHLLGIYSTPFAAFGEFIKNKDWTRGMWKTTKDKLRKQLEETGTCKWQNWVIEPYEVK